MIREPIDLAGVDCAELAPALARHVRPMPAGERIVVATARPSAIEGIRAWCRLTGNILEREERNGDVMLFTIRRKAAAP